jgi:hypothetical protein
MHDIHDVSATCSRHTTITTALRTAEVTPSHQAVPCSRLGASSMPWKQTHLARKHILWPRGPRTAQRFTHAANSANVGNTQGPLKTLCLEQLVHAHAPLRHRSAQLGFLLLELTRNIKPKIDAWTLPTPRKTNTHNLVNACPHIFWDPNTTPAASGIRHPKPGRRIRTSRHRKRSTHLSSHIRQFCCFVTNSKELKPAVDDRDPGPIKNRALHQAGPSAS